MKKLSMALLALAAALAIAPAALADTFYYNFYIDGVSGGGTLVGTELGSSGMYQITGGSITTSSGYGTYSGVVDDTGAFGTDDVLYFNPQTSTGRYLDSDGLLFDMSYGGYNALWAGDDNGDGPGYSIWFYDDADIAYPGIMNVSLTPEPNSLLLLGTGLLGLAFLVFRKAKLSRVTKPSGIAVPA